ncbi:hypothetical protein ACS0TY_010421 [Phlomoides rotata]
MLETGFLKANIDAAFFTDSLEMGFGIIIYDHRGRHIYSRSHVMPDLYVSEVGEAIGHHEALSWVKELGMARVIVEMDAINGDETHNSVFEDIITGCKGLLFFLPHVHVQWIPRDANIMSYRIAKVARAFSSPCYWVERPNCVDGLPGSSCMC